MNNTSLNERQKLALGKVIDYAMSDERKDLEQYLSDEFGESDLSDMTDDELYAFVEADNIEHVWVELYILSKVE